MPLYLVRVDHIGSVGTVNPQVRQYCISATTVDEAPRSVQFVTINTLRASLCERALKVGQLVWVMWKDGLHRSRDIVSVRLDDSRFDSSNPPAEKVI